MPPTSVQVTMRFPAFTLVVAISTMSPVLFTYPVRPLKPLAGAGTLNCP
jgi:hypothetical protein